MKTWYFFFLWMLLVHIGWNQIPISDTLMFTDGKLYYLHVVKPKQTLYSISKAYNVKMDDILQINRLTKKDLQQGQKLLIPSLISPSRGKIILANDNVYSVDYHTVKKGETFYKIAKIYDISSSFLQLLNPDFSENSLKTGYLLLVAKPIKLDQSAEKSKTGQSTEKDQVHVVKKGETLYSISRLYGVSIEEIKKANPQLSEKLSEGQQLIIPIVNTFISCKCEPQLSRKKFDISILLPIKPSPPALPTISKTEEWKPIPEFEFLEFYLGFKMFLNEATLQDIKFKIKPILCDRDTSQIADIFKKHKVQNSDVIISLLQPDQINLLTNLVKDKPIIHVDLAKDESLSREKSNLVQIITPVNVQLKVLAQSLVKNFPDGNFLLAHRSDLFYSWVAEEFASALAEYQASYQIINVEKNGNASLFSKLDVRSQNVVVVFESNEFFVKEFLRQLFNFNATANNKYNITIVGLAGWINFDYIDFDFLEKFRTIFFGSQFVDFSREDVRQFVGKYQQTYHVDPSLKAFAGYDVAKYLVRAMQQFGDCFYNCFDHVSDDSCLSLQISLKRIPDKGWVNQGLQVYEMKNYYLWKKQ